MGVFDDILVLVEMLAINILFTNEHDEATFTLLIVTEQVIGVLKKSEEK